MADDVQPESEIVEGNGTPDASARLTEVHERAMQRFDSVAVPQSEMRAQSLEDRRFVTIPGAMWEGPLATQWENAPRPEVDKITRGLEKIELDYRDNRMIADFVPVGSVSDETTADTLDGMFRADAYHYKAHQAWDTAFQEACRGGFGAWRLTTDYADEYDPDSDEQRVNPGVSIPDADQSVFFDPSSKLYDKSDAKWAFIRSEWMRADADGKWRDGIAPWPLNEWKYSWDWYRPDTVAIAEYYEVEETSDRLLIFENSTTDEQQRFHEGEIEPSAARDLVTGGWTRRSRSVKRRRVHKYIMSGSQVLRDCGYIAGSCIPIVPIYGKRVFVDSMERWEGYVRKKKDSQRQFNASLSRLIEADSRAPFEVPWVNPGQLTPTQAEDVARQNIARLPFLTINPSIDPATGEVVSAGPVGQLKPVDMPAVTTALLQFTLQTLTGDDDNTDQVQANVSADAMEIAKATIDARSGIYIDNARQSHQRGAEIYLEMAREVYYEPGRKVDTLAPDGQDGQATLAEPHMDDQGVYGIRNDLSQGKYKVVADVQEATVTRRAKTVKESLNIAQVATAAQDMELAQAALLTAVANQDGEGMSDFQQYAHKKLVALGVVKPTAEEAQAMQQAAEQQQQGQQPSPQDQALLATAAAQQGVAQKQQADAVKSIAQAHLYTAQADAIGGPEQAPKPPTGLQAANDAADVHETLASARLKDAQAQKLDSDVHHARIRTGLELAQEAHRQSLENRRQDHAESQQAGAA